MIEDAGHNSLRRQLDREDLKTLQKALHQSDALFRSVLEHAPSDMTVIDSEGIILYFNKWASDYIFSLFGRPLEAGAPLMEYIFDKDKHQVEQSVRSAFDGTYVQYETSITSEYTEQWFDIRYSPVRTESGDIIAVLISHQDITGEKRYERQIAHIAFHDLLTGLPNRKWFQDRLHQALDEAERTEGMLAVILLDLDRFKHVNDSLSHQKGDELLAAVGCRLQEALGEKELLARIGGDEYIVLIPEMEREEEAYALTERIMEVLKEPFWIGDHEIRTTFSMGVSLYPSHGKDGNTLMQHSELALYVAKEQGRNTYRMFDPALNEKAQQRIKLETSLRRAVRDQEFVLQYQPKIELEGGRIYGMEALIRWFSPEEGMVMPSRFIPFAEESGLIVPIGEWVLRTACIENKRLQDEGYAPLIVSVNLSACQFMQPDLAERVEQVLEETGLEPHWLELEITESTLMTNPPEAALMLQKLKSLGITLSVDDFGTGFSSLNYLKYFPIDVLKVDGSFVKDLPEGQKDTAITRSIISLAHNLQMLTIAEGVETAQQLEFLQLNGCDAVQGYYLATPLAGDELRSRLSA